MSVLLGLLLNTEDMESSIPHERVLFKFMENNYEKLQRLFELHIKYFQRVEDFDLSKFEESEEIGYLGQDYGFQVLEKADTIIGYLFTSERGRKLSEGDPIHEKIKEFMKFNGIKMEQVKEVLRIHKVTLGE